MRQEILAKVADLKLPITLEQVQVVGEGPRIIAMVNYEMDTSIGPLQRGFMLRRFSHRVLYRPPQ